MWLETQSRSMYTGATTTALGMGSHVSRSLSATGAVGARMGTFFDATLNPILWVRPPLS